MDSTATRIGQVSGLPAKGPARHQAGCAAALPLAVLEGNVQAVEAAHSFAGGTSAFVCLTGSPGWGKTNLGEYTASLVSGRRPSVTRLLTATEWLGLPERPESHDPVILDNIEDAWANPRTKHHLRQRIERRVRLKRPTMLIGNCRPASGNWAIQLPEPRQWLNIDIKAPKKGDRKTIVETIAHREGVHVGETVSRLFAAHMHGNGRSIHGAVQRLGLVKQDWTAPDDVFAACGVLMPYMIGRNGWDPRDVVFDSAVRALAEPGFDHLCPKRVCSYVLIRLMRLSEGSVATFHNSTPRQVYAFVCEVESRLTDHVWATAVERAKAVARASFDEC